MPGDALDDDLVPVRGGGHAGPARPAARRGDQRAGDEAHQSDATCGGVQSSEFVQESMILY